MLDILHTSRTLHFTLYMFKQPFKHCSRGSKGTLCTCTLHYYGHLINNNKQTFKTDYILFTSDGVFAMKCAPSLLFRKANTGVQKGMVFFANTVQNIIPFKQAIGAQKNHAKAFQKVHAARLLPYSEVHSE